tara:strand:- start:1563 stop:2528 length:966 start_codon:yes stop_codon:yes gene_type:complete
MNNHVSFIDTQQYRLFSEFCDACAEHKYIGICYGPPGVGKTLSARRYSNWTRFSGTEFSLTGEAYHEHLKASRPIKSTTILYTPSVAVNAKALYRDIDGMRERIRVSSQKMTRLNQRRDELLNQAKAKRKRERAEYEASQIAEERGLKYHPSCADYETSPTVYEVQRESTELRKKIKDPTQLIIVDETERLSASSLEQVRYIYDEGGVGVLLIGMPGLEKRLARYAQLSSRIGFVHKFNPLKADQVRAVWRRLWSSCSHHKEDITISDEAMTTIIRMTRGNFRLLERLLSQIERVLEINEISEITLEVVEVARENLVIGAA